MPGSRAGIFKNLASAILVSGLIAGTLDGLAAIIQYMAGGKKNPEVIFKYIASGVFGRKAFTGGVPMITWGIVFHYIIALGFTGFFFWLYPAFSSIGKHPILSGLLYGIIVWAIMRFVILPLSLVQLQPFQFSKAIVPVLIIMFCVGLPVSLLANKYYLYKK